MKIVLQNIVDLKENSEFNNLSYAERLSLLLQSSPYYSQRKPVHIKRSKRIDGYKRIDSIIKSGKK